jgi:HSP20 family protein
MSYWTMINEFNRAFDDAVRQMDTVFQPMFQSTPSRIGDRSIEYPEGGASAQGNGAVTARQFRPRYVRYNANNLIPLANTDSANRRLDIQEGNTSFTASFDVPGLKKEDLQIEVHDNRLTIKGETKTESENSNEGYVLRERHWGSFSRTLALPAGTKPEDVKASVKDGVLRITFPKPVTQKPEPRRIEVSDA